MLKFFAEWDTRLRQLHGFFSNHHGLMTEGKNMKKLQFFDQKISP
jgi:hypothetical protein